MGIGRIRIYRTAKRKYDKLNEAVKNMNTPYYNADEFINDQIDIILDQYEKWLKEKEE